jgi:hypothetical protein
MDWGCGSLRGLVQFRMEGVGPKVRGEWVGGKKRKLFFFF